MTDLVLDKKNLWELQSDRR